MALPRLRARRRPSRAAWLRFVFSESAPLRASRRLDARGRADVRQRGRPSIQAPIAAMKDGRCWRWWSTAVCTSPGASVQYSCWLVLRRSATSCMTRAASCAPRACSSTTQHRTPCGRSPGERRGPRSPSAPSCAPAVRTRSPGPSGVLGQPPARGQSRSPARADGRSCASVGQPLEVADRRLGVCP